MVGSVTYLPNKFNSNLLKSSTIYINPFIGTGFGYADKKQLNTMLTLLLFLALLLSCWVILKTIDWFEKI